jgi:hypothetical protein
MDVEEDKARCCLEPMMVYVNSQMPGAGSSSSLPAAAA